MEGFCKTHMPLSDNFALKSKLLIKYFSAASFISYSLISTDFLQISTFHRLIWTLWMRLTENKLMFTVLIFFRIVSAVKQQCDENSPVGI